MKFFHHHDRFKLRERMITLCIQMHIVNTSWNKPELKKKAEKSSKREKPELRKSSVEISEEVVEK